MRVKATVNLGTNDYPLCPLKEGEAGDVDEATGTLMVARGHAVKIEQPPPVAKLVAEPEPAVTPPAPVQVTSTPEVPAVKNTPKAATGRKS